MHQRPKDLLEQLGDFLRQNEWYSAKQGWFSAKQLSSQKHSTWAMEFRRLGDTASATIVFLGRVWISPWSFLPYSLVGEALVNNIKQRILSG
jgi:hypothetical protein